MHPTLIAIRVHNKMHLKDYDFVMFEMNKVVYFMINPWYARAPVLLRPSRAAAPSSRPGQANPPRPHPALQARWNFLQARWNFATSCWDFEPRPAGTLPQHDLMDIDDLALRQLVLFQGDGDTIRPSCAEAALSD